MQNPNYNDGNHSNNNNNNNSTPNSKREDSIQNFIGDNENTMSAVVSASVGKVLFRLKDTYFKEESKKKSEDKLDEEYENFIKKKDEIIKAVAKHITRDPNEENLKLNIEKYNIAINYIIQVANEKPGFLDIINISSKDKENKITSEQHAVPLKHVLALVWKASNDSEKYTHNYKGSPEEQLIQAQKDQIFRWHSFLECCVNLEGDRRCHHGTRNALVMTLNLSYAGVDIIQDARSKIQETIQIKLYEEFLAAFKSKPAMKKQLLSAMITWIVDDNPRDLFNILDKDLKVKIQNELNELFLKNGFDPKSKFSIPTRVPNIRETTTLEQIIENNCIFLRCSLTNDDYPIFLVIMNIYSKSEIHAQNNCNESLKIIKKWIKSSLDIENDEHYQWLNSFDQFYSAYQILTKNESLLRPTGNWDQFEKLKKSCELYFSNLSDTKKFSIIDQENLGMIKILKQTVENIRKDQFIDIIENFFHEYFLSEQLQTPSMSLGLLFNPDFQKKARLTDHDIMEFLSASSNSAEKEISPYEINRIFISAILQKPDEWSDIFYSAFTTVLKFVDNKFNQNQGFNATALKNDSYPEKLITQLKYLENCYHASKMEIPKIARPAEMILMPHSIESAEEWLALRSNLLRVGGKPLVFIAYASNPQGIEKIFVNEINIENFYLILSSMPPANARFFLKRPGLIKRIFPDENALIQLISKDRINIGFNIENIASHFKDIIKSLATIIKILEFIDAYSYLQNIVIDNLIETLKITIQSTEELCSVLSKLNNPQAISKIIRAIKDRLKDIIRDSDLNLVTILLSLKGKTDQKIIIVEAIKGELESIIQADLKKLTSILSSLGNSESAKLIVLESLKGKVNTMIKDWVGFNDYTMETSKLNLAIFHGLSDENLKNYIQSTAHLYLFLDQISKKRKTEVIKSLSSSHLKEIIKYDFSFYKIFTQLSDNLIAQLLLLQHLDENLSQILHPNNAANTISNSHKNSNSSSFKTIVKLGKTLNNITKFDLAMVLDESPVENWNILMEFITHINSQSSNLPRIMDIDPLLLKEKIISFSKKEIPDIGKSELDENLNVNKSASKFSPSFFMESTAESSESDSEILVLLDKFIPADLSPKVSDSLNDILGITSIQIQTEYTPVGIDQIIEKLKLNKIDFQYQAIRPDHGSKKIHTLYISLNKDELSKVLESSPTLSLEDTMKLI